MHKTYPSKIQATKIHKKPCRVKKTNKPTKADIHCMTHKNINEAKIVKKLFPSKIQAKVDIVDYRLKTYQSYAHLLVDFFIGIKKATLSSGIKVYEHSAVNDHYFLNALRNLNKQIKSLLKERAKLIRFY